MSKGRMDTMVNLVLNDKSLQLQISTAAINLNSAMVQLYESATRRSETAERIAEAKYYYSLVEAYSEGNPESESLSELFMGASSEVDELRDELKGNYYE